MSKFETSSSHKNLDQLQGEIIKLRNVIRYHRDQKGDDRCWLDDELLYESLPETADKAQLLPSKEVFMEKCARFHSRRQAPERPKQASQDPDQPTEQALKGMNEDELKKEIARLIQAIRLHRNIGDNKRSWQDDIRLYRILNENTNYDTTLPDQKTFLTSCNRFFSTRRNPPDLHNW